MTSNNPNRTGIRDLELDFVPALTNAGTAPVTNASVEFTCGNPACSSNPGAARIVTSGAVTTNLVQGAFQVRYASNLAVGDPFINVTNTGAISTTAFPTRNGSICENVYTFSPDEQMIACYSCPLTPNALASLSVRSDLISNSLFPGIPTSIVVKLVASGGILPNGTCNSPDVGSSTNPLVPGLAAWGTSVHALPVTAGTSAATFGVAETPFIQAR
ncbi:MAG: hypothetical protein M3Z85_13575 [Acidobacteriota bacterium]|nr:hypothetical protein [Acidobacteriota bacterium]